RIVDDTPPDVGHQPLGIPDTWKLTKGVDPLAWQQQCITKWQKKKGHGTVKVVTGAGKTLLALFIAELLQNTEDRDLHVAIVVPTIVLASASERLPRLVKEANVEEHLMLVADECHHAGANEMSKVLKTKSRWSLGLSATPERDDDDDEGYDESLLGKRLGPIIYEFN